MTPLGPITPQNPIRQPSAAFNWQSFLISAGPTIMASLGGLLLLIATALFEIQSGDPRIKFAVVLIAYIIFGALTFYLRRLPHLQTISGVYLVVFALMSPLLGLAAYLLILGGLISAIGMVCITAAYSACIYLFLAWRTNFLTFGYLGWVATIIAALMIVPWAPLPLYWLLLDLPLLGLLLHASRYLRGEQRRVLTLPAMQLNAVITAASGLGIPLLGLFSLDTVAGSKDLATLADQVILFPCLAAITLSCIAFSVLSFAWALSLRGNTSRAGIAFLNIMEWLIAAYGALSIIALDGSIQVDAQIPSEFAYPMMGYTLAALGLIEMFIALRLRRTSAPRRGLRFSIEGLALVLALIAPLLPFSQSDNFALIVTLSAAAVVASLGSAYEHALGWGLLAGLLLTLDAHAIFNTVLPRELLTLGAHSVQNETTASIFLSPSSLQTALALLFWMCAVALGDIAPRTAGAPATQGQLAAPAYTRPRGYLSPLYLTALGNALVALYELPGHTATYQTVVLMVFASAAVITGWRLNQPLLGGGVSVFFGSIGMAIAMLNLESTLDISAWLIGLMTTALALLWLLGRKHAIGPYIIALWAATLAIARYPSLVFAIHAPVPPLPLGSAPLHWETIGSSFYTISSFSLVFLLLAILASAYALRDRIPELMVPAALLALAAQPTFGTAPATALVLVMVAAGLALRRRRGAGWGISWYAVAFPASLLAIFSVSALSSARLQFPALAAAAPYLAFALWILFLALAYVVALAERQPWVTLAAVPYLLGALFNTPPGGQFIITLGLTLALAGVALLMRLRLGRRWALTLYGLAIVASLFAMLRVRPLQGVYIEALLLFFAAIAYGITYFERTPLAGFVPLSYVTGAIFFQPDPHGLLLMALIIAILAIIAGRVGGPRWSWSAYASAGVAAFGVIINTSAQPGFAVLAFWSLAAMAYIIALVESRPDVLPVAFVLCLGGNAALINVFHLTLWGGVLAYSVLAWGFVFMGKLWRRLGWLRPRGGSWWLSFIPIPQGYGATENAMPAPQTGQGPQLTPQMMASTIISPHNRQGQPTPQLTPGMMATTIISPQPGQTQQPQAHRPPAQPTHTAQTQATPSLGRTQPADRASGEATQRATPTISAMDTQSDAVTTQTAATLRLPQEPQAAEGSTAPATISANVTLRGVQAPPTTPGAPVIAAHQAHITQQMAQAQMLRTYWGDPRIAGEAVHRWAWLLVAVGALVIGWYVGATGVYQITLGNVLTLLGFAGLTYAFAYAEQRPMTGVLMLLYISVAVYFESDRLLLLAIALCLAALALTAGHLSSPRWSWSVYAGLAVAALATILHGLSQPGFEALALGIFTLIAYIIAAAESRPDVLPISFALGSSCVVETSIALHHAGTGALIGFIAMAWAVALISPLWWSLGWLRPRGGMWWLDKSSPAIQAQWMDPRIVGAFIHRWSSLAILAGALLFAGPIFATWTIGSGATLVESIGLLAMAALFAYHAMDTRQRWMRYAAGEFLALAITWGGRWVGADNLQWFILAPGTYQLLIGAILPNDAQIGRPERAGQIFSLIGSVILLGPTLDQSLQANPAWAYALILIAQSLAILGVGLMNHSRLLVALSSAFFLLAIIRLSWIVVSYDSALLPAVIAVGGVLLLGTSGIIVYRINRRTSRQAAQQNTPPLAQTGQTAPTTQTAQPTWPAWQQARQAGQMGQATQWSPPWPAPQHMSPSGQPTQVPPQWPNPAPPSGDAQTSQRLQ